MTELASYESTVIADKSFRTVIPKPVAKDLKLEHGSKIKWTVKVEDGEVFAVVKKV